MHFQIITLFSALLVTHFAPGAAAVSKNARTIFWYKDPYWFWDRMEDGINRCSSATRAAATIEWQYLQIGDVLQAYNSVDCSGTPAGEIIVTEDNVNQTQLYYHTPEEVHTLWSARVKRYVPPPDTHFWAIDNDQWVLAKTFFGIEKQCLNAGRPVSSIEWGKGTRTGDRFRVWRSMDCSGVPELDRVVTGDDSWVHWNLQSNKLWSAAVNDLPEDSASV